MHSIILRKIRTVLRLGRQALWRRMAMPAIRTPGSAPRVLFLSDTAGAPQRYRVRNQAEQLRLVGVACMATDPLSWHLPRLLSSSDILVLYRLDATPTTRRIIAQARARQLRVLYETDDLTWDQRLFEYCAIGQLPPADQQRNRARWQRESALIRMVDGCVCSTPYLASMLRADFQLPVWVNPNAVALDTLAQAEATLAQPVSRPAGQTILGYFSGAAHTHEADLAVAIPAIRRVLSEVPAARLRIVGHFAIDTLPADLQPQIEHLPFVPYEELFRQIAACDINLAPLVDNPHRRCKSAVKLLEAALVGVPTIATDLEPYQQIEHGSTGMLAADDQSWYASIMTLIRDPARRQQIGWAGRAEVLRNHTTAARAPHYHAIMREIYQQK
ncbi:MAG: hypothetical protein Fur005_34160 [Roseiflexaceae bacterium]